MAEGMYYRMMGSTGIQVSVLSYGFWATYGVKSDLSGDQGIETAKELLKIARGAGVNCFDHAEAYGTPAGEAERIFGLALSELVEEDPELWRRSDLVITTKIFWGGAGVNDRGVSGSDDCRHHHLHSLSVSEQRQQHIVPHLVWGALLQRHLHTHQSSALCHRVSHPS